MPDAKRRGVKEGAGFGVVAGIIFAIVEVLGAAMMGNPPLMPFRMFASVLLGQGAMETMSAGGAFVVGTVVHLVLSAAFGAVYGLVNSRLAAETQTSRGRQVGIGLAFGVILWLVNFHIIARILYPWFLMTPQFLQMMMHAVFFGLPLGLLYAGAERRVRTLRPAGAPA